VIRDLPCTCPHGNPEADEEDHLRDCLNATIESILPDSDKRGDPGWRLHVIRAPMSNLELIEEQVLPEKVNDINANRRLVQRSITIKMDEVRWLRDHLDEVIRRDAAENHKLYEPEQKITLAQPIAYSTITEWSSDEYLHKITTICDLCGEEFVLKLGKNYVSSASALANWQINHRQRHR
jgi:hypothetical protein